MKGTVPRFTNLHVWKTMHNVAENKIISRKKLTKKVGVGEGSIRTILTLLKKKDIIKITRVGVSLTEKGKKFLNRFKFQTAQLPQTKLTVAKYNFGAFIRKKAHKISSGIEQRDAAIKAGAVGATTIICKKKKLVFPVANYSFETKEPVLAESLHSKFMPEDNDVIIIGSANSLKMAEEGALAAALELVKFKI